MPSPPAAEKVTEAMLLLSLTPTWFLELPLDICSSFFFSDEVAIPLLDGPAFALEDGLEPFYSCFFTSFASYAPSFANILGFTVFFAFKFGEVLSSLCSGGLSVCRLLNAASSLALFRLAYLRQAQAIMI